MSCNEKKVYKFELTNGNIGEMNIEEELIDSEAIARERAMSEFLKNGYKKRQNSFKTYRTDIKLNSVIKIEGVGYVVKSIKYDWDAVKCIATVTGVRYE